jgi:hypothetical protein
MISRRYVQVLASAAVATGVLLLLARPTFGVAPAPTPSPAMTATPAAAGQLDGQALEAQGYERILRQRRNGAFTKAGWNHYGPGYIELDQETGVLTTHGGMGLLWYTAEEYGDFVLELEFMTEVENANSGVFLRVPGVPSSDDYIYHSWEIQIDDASEGIHHTGAVYDAEAPTSSPSKGPGEWNHYKITFVGDHITVELNGVVVVDWDAEPRGKVEDFTARGYVGLQNHDSATRTFFRNVFIKKLD